MQEASLKDETFHVSIKARSAATAQRRTFRGPQLIICEGVKLVAKWVKREIPLSHAAQPRCKNEAAAYQRLLFSEAFSTAHEKGVGQRAWACCSVQCHPVSCSKKTHLPLQGVQDLGHIHQPCRYLRCFTEDPLKWGAWCSGIQTEPWAPLTETRVQIPKFRGKCHCLEMQLEPVMCYLWLSANCSVIRGYMMVT